MNYTNELHKVMYQEYYRGILLNNVLGKWQYGIKSFDTKDELKKFIDKILDFKITIKQF